MKSDEDHLLTYAEEHLGRRIKKIAKTIRAAKICPCNETAIHDLRVAIRRLVQARDTFTDVLGNRRSYKFRRLKKVMKRCGAVRNCDIAIKILEDAKAPYASGVRKALVKHRADAEIKLQDTLGDFKARQQTKKWRRRLSFRNPADLTITLLAEKQLNLMLTEFYEAGDDVVGHESRLADLHQFRLLAKRLRYTMELFEPVSPDLRQKIDKLRSLQDALGAINDCVCTRDLLRKLETAAHPKTILAIEKLQHQRFSEFVEIWKRDYEDLEERCLFKTIPSIGKERTFMASESPRSTSIN